MEKLIPPTGWTLDKYKSHLKEVAEYMEQSGENSDSNDIDNTSAAWVNKEHFEEDMSAISSFFLGPIKPQDELRCREIFVLRDDNWKAHRTHSFAKLKTMRCYYEVSYKGVKMTESQVREQIVDDWDSKVLMPLTSEIAFANLSPAVNFPGVECGSLEILVEAEIPSDADVNTYQLKFMDQVIGDYTFKVNTVSDISCPIKRITISTSQTYEDALKKIETQFNTLPTKDILTKLENQMKLDVTINILSLNDKWYLSTHTNDLKPKDKCHEKKNVCASEYCSKTGKLKQQVIYRYHYGNRYRWKCCGTSVKNHP